LLLSAKVGITGADGEGSAEGGRIGRVGSGRRSLLERGVVGRTGPLAHAAVAASISADAAPRKRTRVLDDMRDPS
jgi:hypothetical protein